MELNNNRSSMRWLLLFATLFLSLSFAPIPESEANMGEGGRVTVGQLMVSNAKSAGGLPNASYPKTFALGAMLCLLLLTAGSARTESKPRLPMAYRYPDISLRMMRRFLRPLRFESNYLA